MSTYKTILPARKLSGGPNFTVNLKKQTDPYGRKSDRKNE